MHVGLLIVLVGMAQSAADGSGSRTSGIPQRSVSTTSAGGQQTRIPAPASSSLSLPSRSSTTASGSGGLSSPIRSVGAGQATGSGMPVMPSSQQTSGSGGVLRVQPTTQDGQQVPVTNPAVRTGVSAAPPLRSNGSGSLQVSGTSIQPSAHSLNTQGANSTQASGGRLLSGQTPVGGTSSGIPGAQNGYPGAAAGAQGSLDSQGIRSPSSSAGYPRGADSSIGSAYAIPPSQGGASLSGALPSGNRAQPGGASSSLDPSQAAHQDASGRLPVQSAQGWGGASADLQQGGAVSGASGYGRPAYGSGSSGYGQQQRYDATDRAADSRLRSSGSAAGLPGNSSLARDSEMLEVIRSVTEVAPATALQVRATDLVEQAMFEMPQSGPLPLEGDERRLEDVLSDSRASHSRLQTVGAYWRLAVAVADFHFAAEEERWLSDVPEPQDAREAATLQAALVGAQARYREARLAVLNRQYELAEASPVLDAGQLVLPLDAPFIGRYQTHFDAYAQRRQLPSGLAKIDQTLPYLLDLIAARAEAAEASRYAFYQTSNTYSEGRLRVDAVIEAFREIRNQRLALLGVVRDYNLMIAEYALAVGSSRTTQVEVVEMLIDRQRGTARIAARARTAVTADMRPIGNAGR